MLQYDQSGLKKHAQAAREGLETLINQIDELAKAPFVETIASELRATQVAAERALKEVETAERYLQNYDDRINNRISTRELITAPTIIDQDEPPSKASRDGSDQNYAGSLTAPGYDHSL